MTLKKRKKSTILLHGGIGNELFNCWPLLTLALGKFFRHIIPRLDVEPTPIQYMPRSKQSVPRWSLLMEMDLSHISPYFEHTYCTWNIRTAQRTQLIILITYTLCVVGFPHFQSMLSWYFAHIQNRPNCRNPKVDPCEVRGNVPLSVLPRCSSNFHLPHA
jgi:hypothetical protein